MPSLGLTLGRLMDLMEFLLLFSRTVPLCWHPAWSNSSVFAYQHLPFLPVPKKGDRSNRSNYRPIDLLSCLSKAFETILNKWFLKYLSSFNFLSDRQYGFRKGRSTGDLLAFLTNSWSSSLSCFDKTFAVSLDISKAIDRVWHKSLLSKLPSYRFCPSLCTFISNFLSGPSISVVVDGYCSKPKSINSGVPQGSVLSPTHWSQNNWIGKHRINLEARAAAMLCFSLAASAKGACCYFYKNCSINALWVYLNVIKQLLTN